MFTIDRIDLTVSDSRRNLVEQAHRVFFGRKRHRRSKDLSLRQLAYASSALLFGLVCQAVWIMVSDDGLHRLRAATQATLYAPRSSGDSPSEMSRRFSVDVSNSGIETAVVRIHPARQSLVAKGQLVCAKGWLTTVSLNPSWTVESLCKGIGERVNQGDLLGWLGTLRNDEGPMRSARFSLKPVFAPCTGLIADVLWTGNRGFVPHRETLMTIYDTNAMSVHFELPIEDLDLIRPGSPFTFAVNDPDANIQGTVIEIHPNEGGATVVGNVTRFQLSANPPPINNEISHLDGTGTIRLRERPSRTVIPRSAVRTDSRGSYVFICSEEMRRCIPERIVCGPEFGENIELISPPLGGQRILARFNDATIPYVVSAQVLGRIDE